MSGLFAKYLVEFPFKSDTLLNNKRYIFRGLNIYRYTLLYKQLLFCSFFFILYLINILNNIIINLFSI